MNKKSSPTFISLKWKSGLLFGLILLIFNASFPALVYWNLQQKFNFSRQQIQQHYQQQLIGQLKSTREQMQRLAEMSLIPDKPNATKIIRLLNKNQLKLELEWHTTQAQLFDSSASKLGGWGNETPIAIISAIKTVFDNEHPVTMIDCSQGCKQYNLIPVLTSSQTEYVLLLAYDLSNTFIEFANETAADVAVLTHTKQVSRSIQPDKILPEWNMEISALTSFKQNTPYLHRLAKEHDFTTLVQTDHLFRDNNLPVEFNFIVPAGKHDIVFIIIDNIAKQQQEILDITYRSLFISLLSVLFLGGGLFFFMSKPLSRLSTVSQALPLLATQHFDHVRSLIPRKNTHQTIDELDQLENSTHALTSQLESLHKSVKERSESLHNRGIELQQERDFVKSLIDTAQLIIITIDKHCRITSFNDFAERSTGYLESNILNAPFKRFVPQDHWKEVESTLIHLKKNPGAVSQQESEFIHKDGNIHLISWLYSSMAHPSENGAVLAVGLDITDKKKDENKIIWLAEHDVLTELYNRHKFSIEFEKILTRSKRFNHQGSLLFLDLDQFKDINDSCGHDTGDMVLKQIAKLLQSIIRETDIVARLGGDEFAIILTETEPGGAIILAEKIISQLADMNLNFNDTHYKVTTSIGIVNFPLSELTIEELVSNADLAMYEAKSHGKNTWFKFELDGQSRKQLEVRVLWKQRIEDALEHNRFIFYYQPIMNIHTREVSHYESLIRMRGEDGTIYPPATFIQVAEQTGLIHHIDHLVLNEGINKQAELDKMQQNISLSLNLSGHAVDDALLLPMLKRLIHDSGVNPEHLIFELTETAAVADLLQAKELMDQLTELGCRFSLDDFGTGFASFRYMRELPVDIVKIDGSFISNLADNPDDQLFVKALVDVAKGMGKKTIAEFVENAETLALLHTFGVDYAQGYYIGKPEPEFLDGPPKLG